MLEPLRQRALLGDRPDSNLNTSAALAWSRANASQWVAARNPFRRAPIHFALGPDIHGP